MAATSTEFTHKLVDEGFASEEQLDALLPLVYADLKRIAHGQLLRHVPGATMSTTVLVHETWARLAERSANLKLTQMHFLSLCARVMRQVIVDHARTRAADKRGGALARVELRDSDAGEDGQAEALILLAAALDSLEHQDRRLVRLIEQHWFIGLNVDELAALYGVTARTIQRELKRARAWVAALLLP